MKEILKTRTTYIGGWWHCQVLKIDDSSIVSESKVEYRCDVGYAFRDMFRMLDKTGWCSPMAHASRMRGKNHGLSGKYVFVK
jgi:hypothetical protein